MRMQKDRHDSQQLGKCTSCFNFESVTPWLQGSAALVLEENSGAVGGGDVLNVDQNMLMKGLGLFRPTWQV